MHDSHGRHEGGGGSFSWTLPHRDWGRGRDGNPSKVRPPWLPVETPPSESTVVPWAHRQSRLTGESLARNSQLILRPSVVTVHLCLTPPPVLKLKNLGHPDPSESRRRRVFVGGRPNPVVGVRRGTRKVTGDPRNTGVSLRPYTSLGYPRAHGLKAITIVPVSISSPTRGTGVGDPPRTPSTSLTPSRRHCLEPYDRVVHKPSHPAHPAHRGPNPQEASETTGGPNPQGTSKTVETTATDSGATKHGRDPRRRHGGDSMKAVV